MNFETWAAFAVAASVVLVIPGPTIVLVVSQAASCGKRSVFPLAAGVALGDLTALTFSLLGLGAVLAASAALFSTLKLIGAGYLVFLGIRLWRSGAVDMDIRPAGNETSGFSLFKSAYIVTSLNPKSIMFFAAFLPQFVRPEHPVGAQLFILGATFLTLGTINAALYGIFAGYIREKTARGASGRLLNRCGATVLIGAGLFTAALKRTS